MTLRKKRSGAKKPVRKAAHRGAISKKKATAKGGNVKKRKPTARAVRTSSLKGAARQFKAVCESGDFASDWLPDNEAATKAGEQHQAKPGKAAHVVEILVRQ